MASTTASKKMPRKALGSPGCVPATSGRRPNTTAPRNVAAEARRQRAATPLIENAEAISADEPQITISTLLVPTPRAEHSWSRTRAEDSRLSGEALIEARALSYSTRFVTPHQPEVAVRRNTVDGAQARSSIMPRGRSNTSRIACASVLAGSDAVPKVSTWPAGRGAPAQWRRRAEFAAARGSEANPRSSNRAA